MQLPAVPALLCRRALPPPAACSVLERCSVQFGERAVQGADGAGSMRGDATRARVGAVDTGGRCGQRQFG